MVWTSAASIPREPDSLELSTRERVLDTAEKLFAERGFAGAAVRDIAQRVSLKAPSLYNHFPSKQALYAAVLDRGLQPLYSLLDELARSDWSAADLDRIADVFVQRLAERPQVPRLLLHETLAGGEQLAELVHKWLRPLYEHALETFRGRGEVPLRVWGPEELPFLLMGFHHLILSHFAMAPMVEKVLGADPLSEAIVQRYREFVRKIVRLLLVEPPAQGASALTPGREGTA